MKKGILLGAIALFCFLVGCKVSVDFDDSDTPENGRVETGILSKENRFTLHSPVRLDAEQTGLDLLALLQDPDSAMTIRLTLPRNHFAADDTLITARIRSVDMGPSVPVAFYRNGENAERTCYYYTSRTAKEGKYALGKVVFFMDEYRTDNNDTDDEANFFYRIPLAETLKYEVCYPSDVSNDTCTEADENQ